MDLQGFESYVTTGLPAVGATVTAREAVVTHPNTGTVLATTTTDANGMWTFAGLSDTPKDIKVVYSGQTWWYKGLTKLSASALYTATAPEVNSRFPLIRNGGLDQWPDASVVTIQSSDTLFAYLWFGIVSGGDSATVQSEATIVTPDSLASAKLVYTHVAGSVKLRYFMPVVFAYNLRGKTITYSVQVRQTVANSLRAYINDGITTTYSARSATTGAFGTYSVTATIGAAATSLHLGIEMDVTGTAYVDDAAMIIGTSAPVFGPNPFDPATVDEYALTDNSVTDNKIGNRVINGTTVPGGYTGKLQVLLDSLANRINAAVGGADWLANPAISLANAYTAILARVLKTGDTMTGNLTFSDDSEGIVLSGGSKLVDIVATPATTLIANTDRFDVLDHLGNLVFRAAKANSGLVFGGSLGSATVWDSLNQPIGTWATAGHTHLYLLLTGGTLSGNLQVNAAFGATGLATLAGNATVGGTLGVAGAATFSTTAAVTGNATVGGTLGVTGASSLNGTVSTNAITASGNITANAALSVAGGSTLTGNTTVGGTLGVTGAATFTAGVTVGTTLGVSGATTLSSTLGVTGVATFSSTATFNDAVTVNATLNATTLQQGGVGVSLSNHTHTNMVAGSYVGDGTALKTINSMGMDPTYVVVTWNNGTQFGMFHIVDAATNAVGSWFNGTNAVVTQAAGVRLVSGGFTINSVASPLNTSGITYIYRGFRSI